MDRQNVTLEKETHLCYSASSGIGSGGASTHLKVLICQNQNKIAENLGKNGGQYCLISKYGTQHFQKNT